MASNYKVVEVPCTGDWETGRPWIMINQVIYVGDMDAPHSDVWSWLKYHGLFSRDNKEAYDCSGWVTASGVHWDTDEETTNFVDRDEVNAALAPYVIDARREAYGKIASDPDWRTLTIQVVVLASQMGGQISWDVRNPEDAFNQTWGQGDYVAHCAPIKSELSYYIALHEVGHMAFKSMYDPKDLATNSEEEELWCHHFALENAQIPISQETIAAAMHFFESYENNKNVSEPSDANPGWLKDYPRQAASLYDQETEPDWNALQQEIVQWASLFDAEVTFDITPDMSAYVDHYHDLWHNQRSFNDHLHLHPITNAYTYAVDLHELGHVDFRMRYRDPYRDRDFDSSQEEELYAWHWMLEHSRIPLDQTTLERVQKAYQSYQDWPEKSPTNPGWIKQDESAPSKWDWLKPNWGQQSKTAERLPEDMTKKLIDHLQTMASELKINLRLLPGIKQNDGWVDFNDMSANVPYPYTEMGYLAALHEIGHIMFGRELTDEVYDRDGNTQEEEWWSWHWALEQAIIPISVETLQWARKLMESYRSVTTPPGNRGWITQPEQQPLFSLERPDIMHRQVERPNYRLAPEFGKMAAATMYHITEQPPEIIQQEGIDYTKHPGWPKTDELYDNDSLPSGNYVWDTINNARIFGDYLNIHPAYIYTVDVNGLDLVRDPWFDYHADKEDDELFRGPHGIHGAFVTRDPITPDRIRAIEKYDNYAWNNPYLEAKVGAAQILIDTESNYKDGPVILDEHEIVWYGIGYHNHEQLQAEILRNGGGYEIGRAEIHHLDSMPLPQLYFGWRGNKAPTTEQEQYIIDQLKDAGVKFELYIPPEYRAKIAGATFYRVTPTNKRDQILRYGLEPLFDSGGPRIWNQQYTDLFRVPGDPSTAPERMFSLDPDDHGEYDSDADMSNRGMHKIYLFQTIEDAKTFAERYRLFEDQDLWQVRLPDTDQPMWHDDRSYSMDLKLPPVFVNNAIPPENLTLLESYVAGSSEDVYNNKRKWVAPDLGHLDPDYTLESKVAEDQLQVFDLATNIDYRELAQGIKPTNQQRSASRSSTSASETWYHVAPQSAREDILKNGIRPKPAEFKDNPDGVYFWEFDPRDDERAKDLGAEYNSSLGDLYAIDGSDLPVYPDRWLPHAFYTTEYVGPERLQLLNSSDSMPLSSTSNHEGTLAWAYIPETGELIHGSNHPSLVMSEVGLRAGVSPEELSRVMDAYFNGGAEEAEAYYALRNRIEDWADQHVLFGWYDSTMQPYIWTATQGNDAGLLNSYGEDALDAARTNNTRAEIGAINPPTRHTPVPSDIDLLLARQGLALGIGRLNDILGHGLNIKQAYNINKDMSLNSSEFNTHAQQSMLHYSWHDHAHIYNEPWLLNSIEELTNVRTSPIGEINTDPHQTCPSGATPWHKTEHISNSVTIQEFSNRDVSIPDQSNDWIFSGDIFEKVSGQFDIREVEEGEPYFSWDGGMYHSLFGGKAFNAYVMIDKLVGTAYIQPNGEFDSIYVEPQYRSSSAFMQLAQAALEHSTSITDDFRNDKLRNLVNRWQNKASEKISDIDPFNWNNNAFIWTPETGLIPVYNHTEGIKQLKRKGIDPYTGVYGWTNPDDKSYYIESFNQQEYQNSDNFKAAVKAMQDIGYHWAIIPWNKLNEGADKDISLSNHTLPLSVEFPNRLSMDTPHLSGLLGDSIPDGDYNVAFIYHPQVGLVRSMSGTHPQVLKSVFETLGREDPDMDKRKEYNDMYMGWIVRTPEGFFIDNTSDLFYSNHEHEETVLNILRQSMPNIQVWNGPKEFPRTESHFEHTGDVSWEQFGDRWTLPASAFPGIRAFIYDGVNNNLFLNSDLDCAPYHSVMLKKLDGSFRLDYRLHPDKFLFGSANQVGDSWDYRWDSLEEKQGDLTLKQPAMNLLLPRLNAEPTDELPKESSDVEQGDAKEWEEPDMPPAPGLDSIRWDGSFWYDPRDRHIYWQAGNGHPGVAQTFGLKRDDLRHMIPGWLMNTTGTPFPQFFPNYSEEGPFTVNTWGGDEPGENVQLPKGTKRAIEQALRDQLGLNIIESHFGAIIDLRDEPQSNAFPDLRQTARAVAFVGIDDNIYFGYDHTAILKQIWKGNTDLTRRQIMMQLIDGGIPVIFGWADRIGPDDPWNVEITSGNYEEVNQAYKGYDEKIRRQVQQYLNTGKEW